MSRFIQNFCIQNQRNQSLKYKKRKSNENFKIKYDRVFSNENLKPKYPKLFVDSIKIQDARKLNDEFRKKKIISIRKVDLPILQTQSSISKLETNLFRPPVIHYKNIDLNIEMVGKLRKKLYKFKKISLYFMELMKDKKHKYPRSNQTLDKILCSSEVLENKEMEQYMKIIDDSAQNLIKNKNITKTFDTKFCGSHIELKTFLEIAFKNAQRKFNFIDQKNSQISILEVNRLIHKEVVKLVDQFENEILLSKYKNVMSNPSPNNVVNEHVRNSATQCDFEFQNENYVIRKKTNNLENTFTTNLISKIVNMDKIWKYNQNKTNLETVTENALQDKNNGSRVSIIGATNIENLISDNKSHQSSIKSIKRCKSVHNLKSNSFFKYFNNNFFTIQDFSDKFKNQDVTFHSQIIHNDQGIDNSQIVKKSKFIEKPKENAEIIEKIRTNQICDINNNLDSNINQMYNNQFINNKLQDIEDGFLNCNKKLTENQTNQRPDVVTLTRNNKKISSQINITKTKTLLRKIHNISENKIVSKNKSISDLIQTTNNNKSFDFKNDSLRVKNLKSDNKKDSLLKLNQLSSGGIDSNKILNLKSVNKVKVLSRNQKLENLKSKYSQLTQFTNYAGDINTTKSTKIRELTNYSSVENSSKSKIYQNNKKIFKINNIKHQSTKIKTKGESKDKLEKSNGKEVDVSSENTNKLVLNNILTNSETEKIPMSNLVLQENNNEQAFPIKSEASNFIISDNIDFKRNEVQSDIPQEIFENMNLKKNAINKKSTKLDSNRQIQINQNELEEINENSFEIHKRSFRKSRNSNDIIKFQDYTLENEENIQLDKNYKKVKTLNHITLMDKYKKVRDIVRNSKENIKKINNSISNDVSQLEIQEKEKKSSPLKNMKIKKIIKIKEIQKNPIDQEVRLSKQIENLNIENFPNFHDESYDVELKKKNDLLLFNMNQDIAFRLKKESLNEDEKLKFEELVQNLKKMNIDKEYLEKDFEENIKNFRGEMKNIEQIKNTEERINLFFMTLNNLRRKNSIIRENINKRYKVKDKKPNSNFKFELDILGEILKTYN